MKMPPPKYPLRFLRWFCREDYIDEIEGDLLELFEKRVEHSPKRARWRFAWDVGRSFRVRNIKTFKSQNSNSKAMFQHYFKISWRNLLRSKGYSLINIGGLAAGITVVIFIGLWVYDELSFNKYHENYNTIVKVYWINQGANGKVANAAHATGMGTLLKHEYGSHFKHVVMVTPRAEGRVVALGEKKFSQSGYFMQEDGPEMLTLKMVYGSRNGLSDMKSILLSESLSKKLFGPGDPTGEVVSMDAKWDLKVTGVYEDLPKNSEFRGANYLAPLDFYFDGWASLNEWDYFRVFIYAQINSARSFQAVTDATKNAMLPHVDEETAATKPEVFLLPMSKWHLYSQFENGVPVFNQRMKMVWYYSIIGVFVLLLACINFMNLSTARSEKRGREVGILKSLGSRRSQLVQQFFGESLLASFLAFAASVLVVGVSISWFNELVDKQIPTPWNLPVFWLAGLGLILFTGFLAGSYPALYLSSLDPVKVLKGTFKADSSVTLSRRLLVIVQFTVSISLVIGTIIVYEQIQFAKDRPVGYIREGLISVRTIASEFAGKFPLLRNELKKTGMVEEIAETNYAVTDPLGWSDGFSWNGQKIEPPFNTIFVTHEYGQTVGWELLEGRDFSREMQNEGSGIVINESARKILGISDPVGETLHWDPGWRDAGNYKILGVVKDMVKGSPYLPTYPSIIFLNESHMQFLYMRLNPNVNVHNALSKIQSVFTSIAPSAPFDYKFADEEYALKFAGEERVGKLASVFALLAILISCLGLIGLASFVAEQRTKEIGIRKVLGASVANLWRMLTKDFLVLVVISSFIAMPLAWYFMSIWLESYVYRTTISGYIFAITGVGALVITLCTVSFQAIKAAKSNPVKSLKTE